MHQWTVGAVAGCENARIICARVAIDHYTVLACDAGFGGELLIGQDADPDQNQPKPLQAPLVRDEQDDDGGGQRADQRTDNECGATTAQSNTLAITLPHNHSINIPKSTAVSPPPRAARTLLQTSH